MADTSKQAVNTITPNGGEPSVHLTPQKINYLRALEAESIYILREAAAEFARPVMLYSIGKDSSVMLRLAQKAFYPGKIPFPLLHIDTSYKFPEMIEFRDCYAREIGAELIVHKNQEALDAGRESVCAGHAEMLRPAEDEVAARRAGRRRIRRGVRRRAARRGKIARQGAHLFLPRFAWASGIPRISGRSCGTSSIRASTRAKAFASFRSRIGPSWTSGSTSTLENIPIVPLYFAKEREAVVRGGSIVVLHDKVGPAARRKDAADGEVPHALARLRAVHRRDPLRRRHGAQDHRGDDLVPPLGARKPR